MEILHIKKNTLDRHANLLLLLIPIVVFLVTLATLLAILNTRPFSPEGRTVSGQKTQTLDAQ